MSKQLNAMAGDHKAVLLPRHRLELLDWTMAQRNLDTAVQADKPVLVRTAIDGVLRQFPWQFYFIDKIHLDEQAQITVYRIETHIWIDRPNLLIDLISGQFTMFCCEEHLKQHPALWGQFAPHLLEPPENIVNVH